MIMCPFIELLNNCILASWTCVTSQIFQLLPSLFNSHLKSEKQPTTLLPWCTSKSYGMIWNHMELWKVMWHQVKSYEIKWNQIEIIWNHMESNRNHMKSHGLMQSDLELNDIIRNWMERYGWENSINTCQAILLNHSLESVQPIRSWGHRRKH